MKRSEELTPSTTWRSLENIHLHERNQTQKVTYSMTPFVFFKKSE
jgi:hypothetical protein